MSYSASFKQSTKSGNQGYGGSQAGGAYFSTSTAGVGFGGAAGYGGGFAFDGSALGGGYGGGYGGGFGGGYGGGFGGGAAGGFGGGASGGFGGGAGGTIGIGNEKEAMQDLNGRLASYLDKVHELEAKNAELERKIKEWLDKHGPAPAEAPKDYSKYYKEIEDLKVKIITASKDNAVILLQCDNARLAADDFKQKYESEHVLSQAVEADINGLHKVMDDLNMSKTDLQSQLDGLTEELTYLKKNHDEEVKAIKAPVAGTVSVEMHAAPGSDLTKLLNDMRAQYEDLAQRNRKEAEDNFNKLSADLKKQIDQGQTVVVESSTEVTNLKRALQSLEIELQSLLAQKKSLEMQLAETEGRFCTKLSHIQENIASIEQHLEQLRAESECQKDEYDQLLDLKTKLEAEIKTYQSLLDKLGAIKVSQGEGQTRGGQTRGQDQMQSQTRGSGQQKH